MLALLSIVIMISAKHSPGLYSRSSKRLSGWTGGKIAGFSPKVLNYESTEIRKYRQSSKYGGSKPNRLGISWGVLDDLIFYKGRHLYCGPVTGFGSLSLRGGKS